MKKHLFSTILKVALTTIAIITLLFSSTVYLHADEQRLLTKKMLTGKKLSGLPGDTITGKWEASSRDGSVNVQFKSKERTSSSSSFQVTDFSEFISAKKEVLTLVRDAGEIIFSGRFAELVGAGTYRFIPAPGYLEKLKSDGITEISVQNLFTYFLMNIKKDYVANLSQHGCKLKSNSDLITFSALKINPDYIDILTFFGYGHLKNHEIISAKASGIDSTFLSKMKDEMKEHLTIYQLIRIKPRYAK